MMGTVYPGSRFEMGGDFTINQFIAGFTNIFLPYSKSIANPCEISTYMYSTVGLVGLIIYYINNCGEKLSCLCKRLVIFMKKFSV